MKLVLNIYWKDWCWSWNCNTLATWCKELTHWERPWCWERLKAGGEGDNRGWDGWMVSPTQGTWVWVNSRSWWWTGKPGVLQSMGLQRVGHNWAAKLTNLLKAWWFSSEHFKAACSVKASLFGKPFRWRVGFFHFPLFLIFIWTIIKYISVGVN